MTVTGLTSGFNEAFAVSAGNDFSCALNRNIVTAASSVRCWGDNGYGQLGNGAAGTVFTAPVTVTGVSNVLAISSGGSDRTCVLLAGGSLKCWGRNGGALGNGTVTAYSSTAVPVTGITTATMVSVGGDHSCAANGTSGDAWCRGTNGNGELGDGLVSIGRSVPYFLGGTLNATSISAGSPSGNGTSKTSRTACAR